METQRSQEGDVMTEGNKPVRRCHERCDIAQERRGAEDDPCHCYPVTGRNEPAFGTPQKFPMDAV